MAPIGRGFLGRFNRAVGVARNTALRAIQTVSSTARSITQSVQRHPIRTASVVLALAAIGVTLVAPHVVLGGLGWQASGVAAGSVAASIQSFVYGAWTSGAFAAIQSFTMSGAAVPIGMLVGGAFSLTGAVGLLGLTFWRSGGKDGPEMGENIEGMKEKKY